MSTGPSAPLTVDPILTQIVVCADVLVGEGKARQLVHVDVPLSELGKVTQDAVVDAVISKATG